MGKTYLTTSVYEAALERMRRVFADFDAVSVSFSGGKDSTVLLHLALQVAEETGRLPLPVLFLDLEGQYQATIAHVMEMMNDPRVCGHWVCLPLNLRNAVSVYAPHWCCWEPGQEEQWVRPLPAHPSVISDPAAFLFFRYRMEFEDFVPSYGEWLAAQKGAARLAVLVGIRADESLNRFRTIVRDRDSRWQGLGWTCAKSERVWNAYPIYDWRVEDIWAYLGKTGAPYNHLYDQMYLTGKSLSEMRICQPYGDDQRRGLDQFHQIEPQTWARIVQRVQGANFGSLYCGQKMLGYHSGLGLPPGQTWRTYTHLLLKTLPEASRRHYRQKFAVFIRWWREKGGVRRIPDASPRPAEAAKKVPSWRRMALCILKNDFWCKSLSFAMTKDLYGKYYTPLESAQQKWSDL